MFGRTPFWPGKEKLPGTVMRNVLFPLIVTGETAGKRIGAPCPEIWKMAACDVSDPPVDRFTVDDNVELVLFEVVTETPVLADFDDLSRLLLELLVRELLPAKNELTGFTLRLKYRPSRSIFVCVPTETLPPGWFSRGASVPRVEDFTVVLVMVSLVFGVSF